MNKSLRALVPALALAVLATAAAAQTAPYDKTFVTKRAAVCGGQKLNYTATVGPTILTDEAGQPAVSFVTTSYVRDGVKDAANRPVIFAWAGGPSGASIAYHTKLLGPRRILNPPKGREAEGQKIVDNPDCMLDVTDIVMVDPAETGFSRILPGGSKPYFYSVAGDAASIEQFMDRWLKAHGREASPRYVMGGSYGSVRAIRIAYDLKDKRPVDGVIVTGNSGMLQETGGLLSYATALPSMAMTALYHGKGDRAGRTDPQIVDDTYRFAMNEYLPALATVQDLTPEQRAAMAGKLSVLTGVPAELILANDLAVTRDMFFNNVLKDKGLYLPTPSDGRITAPIGQPAPAGFSQDVFYQYMRDLGVTYPMTEYNATAPNSNRDWVYQGPKEALAPNGVGNDWPKMLRMTMTAAPKMRVFSANGHFDNLSTLGQARYLFSRTRLPKDRIVVREYPGEHGLYSEPATATLIAQDIRRMLAAR